jgi:putative transposase
MIERGGELPVTRQAELLGLSRTSVPAREATIYPYLLGEVTIERPNQVWASDITYLPMAHGFLYLAADFCVEALEEALRRYGPPEIFNTDQGAQLTSEEWIETLKAAEIEISMDGKGRWIDNVFIERLWRSVKYEEVDLHGYANGGEARAGLAKYFEFYNARRTHQSHEYQTPDEVYFGVEPPRLAQAA